MKKIILLLSVCCFSFGFSFAEETKKAAYLSIYDNISEIDDDDEIASAQWFVNTYGGDFLPLSDLQTTDLSQYAVIMIHVDDEFFPEPYEELLEQDVLEALNAYYKGGGNLLLCIHGVYMLYELGRIDIKPDLLGTGGATANPDVWYVSPTHGTDVGMVVYDCSSDRIYSGLTSEPVERLNGNEYLQFPLIDATMKEDHNCFWTMDLPDNFIENNLEAKLTTFQTTYNVDVLGTWAHVEDYFGAAIARWKPQGGYQGTAITIGVAAYEWDPNSTTNSYQSNIERLTANALDELRDSGANGLSFVSENNVAINFDNNILRVTSSEELLSADLYSANGILANKFNTDQLLAGVDLSNLPQGVYIIRLEDNLGKVVATQKIVK